MGLLSANGLVLLLSADCMRSRCSPTIAYVAMVIDVQYVIAPHTLLLDNTSGSFLFIPFVEQCLSHLCDALQTCHMLNTLRHLRELASCTNYLPTQK